MTAIIVDIFFKYFSWSFSIFKVIEALIFSFYFRKHLSTDFSLSLFFKELRELLFRITFIWSLLNDFILCNKWIIKFINSSRILWVFCTLPHFTSPRRYLFKFKMIMSHLQFTLSTPRLIVYYPDFISGRCTFLIFYIIHHTWILSPRF